jgi:hypothetical protein
LKTTTKNVSTEQKLQIRINAYINDLAYRFILEGLKAGLENGNRVTASLDQRELDICRTPPEKATDDEARTRHVRSKVWSIFEDIIPDYADEVRANYSDEDEV